jgi:SAM-dependent methyltransferase
MRFSRKLEKLFSLELLQSISEHASRWTHPVNARRILATLDRTEFEKLRERYPYRSNSARINRFEDATYWIGINVERAQDLWLDRTPALRILDVGCGAGYFLYVCKFFGHEGLGLDTDDEPLYRATTTLLNVRRTISRIDPQTPLPNVGEEFDLVTAHRICFHRLGRALNGDFNEWASADWKFFINDIRSRFLKPEGRLLLDFNPRPDGSSFFTDELRACFLAEGARIFRSKALFAADPNQRPRFKQTGRGGSPEPPAGD